MEIDNKLNRFLQNVGDMSLKRRAKKLIAGLELNPKDKIIDLGCGDGFYLYLLKSLPIKFDLIGFDKDDLVLTNAEINLRAKDIQLIKGDIIMMPFKKNSFQKAIMTEVLEHIKNERKALSEVYRILKPSAILVLTVPSLNFPFLWDPINWTLQKLFGFHIRGTNFFAGIWARHERLYKKEYLKTIVKNAGFKIIECEELTTRCLPFNHYIINLVARILYDIKPRGKFAASLSKFKNTKKPLIFRMAFLLVNLFDKLNDIIPGRYGVNIYIKAVKISTSNI